MQLTKLYSTRLVEVNAITYPCFIFDYPDNWTIAKEEVTLIADSIVMTGNVQATDYSILGKFMVAKLKTTGHLDMVSGSNFTDVDDTTSCAILPESGMGINENVRQPFDAEFSFLYSNYISFIGIAPNEQFTEQEEQEVQRILSSFRIE